MSSSYYVLPSTSTIAPGWRKTIKNNFQIGQDVIVQTFSNQTLLTMMYNSEATFTCVGGWYVFSVPSSTPLTASPYDTFNDSLGNIWTILAYNYQSYGDVLMTGSVYMGTPPSSGTMTVLSKALSTCPTTAVFNYTSWTTTTDAIGNWDVSYKILHDSNGNAFTNNTANNFETNNLSTNPFVMSAANGKYQEITGSVSSGVVQLPSGSIAGVEYILLNSNSNNITIKSNSSTTVGTLLSGATVNCLCIASGSPPSWSLTYPSSSGSGSSVNSVTGDGVLINNSGSTGAVTLTRPTVAGVNQFYANTTNLSTPAFRTASFTDISGQATLAQLPTGSSNQVLAGNNSWINSFPMDSWSNSSGDRTLLHTNNVVQYINGSTAAINCFLPDSSTCQQGQIFFIINDSSDNVIVYDHVGSSDHITLFPNRILLANNFSSASNGFWYWSVMPSNYSGNFPVLDANYGGTGQITYSPGDLLYANASFPSTVTQALSRLSIGSSGQVLTSNGTSPTWSTLQNTFASVNMNGTPTNLVLTNTSATVQYITAYTSGNILLPDTTTCTVGQTFYIINSTPASYIPLKNSSGGNIFGAGAVLPASTNLGIVCFSTSSANQWDKIGLTSVGGGSSVFGYIGAGGLGINQWPAANELIVSGTASSGTAPCDFVSNVSTSGIPLVSTGTSTKPQFTTATVSGGGTGQTTFTSGGVLFGQGTSGLGVTAVGSSGQVLTSSGSGTGPTWTTPSSGSITSVTGDGTLTTTSTTSGAVTITIPIVTGTNKFWANDPTTGNQAPTFRTIASSDLPNPTTSAKGGVEAINSMTSNWINSISTSGVPSLSQPAFTDISGSATLAQLPTGSANQFLAGNNSWKNAFPMDTWNNSSGDYTMLNTYNVVQYITGASGNINLSLPNSSTCQQGQIFMIINDSFNNVTVHDYFTSSHNITLFPNRVLLANNYNSSSFGNWYWSILPSNYSGNLPVLDANYGGTGRITYNTGDLLYASNAFPSSSSQSLSNLGIGSAYQVLQVNSGATAPTWGNLLSGSLFSGQTYGTSSSTLTLTAASPTYTRTNASNLIVAMPGTTTVPLGTIYIIDFTNSTNNSIQNATGGTIVTIPSGSGWRVTLIYSLQNSAFWNYTLQPFATNTSANTAFYTVGLGGTGAGTFTSNALIYGNGTSAFGSVSNTSSGTGIPLVSGATSSVLPSFGTASVAGGGTGQTSFTANGVLYGNATSGLLVTAQGAASTYLTANAGAPTFTSYAPTAPTPTIAVTSGTVTVGYVGQTCSISKIGNLCLISIQIVYNSLSHTGTGNIVLQISPSSFPTSSNSEASVLLFAYPTATLLSVPGTSVIETSSQLGVFDNTGANIPVAALPNNGVITVTGVVPIN